MNNIRNLLDKTGGRKLIASAIAFITSTALLCAGFIDGQTWSNLTMMIIGVYIGGNVVSKFQRQNNNMEQE